jgi:hypothetical protein
MKRSFLPPPLLHGAGKWLTLSLTTTAALVGLIVNAQNLGLTAWLGSKGLSFANLAARRVLVSPARDTLEAIGDTLQLAATVVDERGGTITGATLVWRSMNPSVATVDSSGAVVARGPGSTLIAVSVRDLAARTVITVAQRVVGVEVADTVARFPEGTVATVEAHGVDARGYRVSGRPVAWVSSDTTVVAVDDRGVAHGRAPGRAVLTASLETFSDRVTVEVVLTPAAVRIVAGDGQRAPAGLRLAQPVVVEVLSRGGRPVDGVPVTFVLTDGAGVIDPPVATTDRIGRARATWTLSAVPGRQRLAASVGGVDSTVFLTAEADPVSANTRVELLTPELRGPAGGDVSGIAVVRVTDTLGAALVDVPIAWWALDGGSVEPLANRTDSAGEGRARWKLGTRAGPQRARVQVGSARSVPVTTISAVALPGGPAAVTVVSGDKQEATVAAELRRPVVVRVADPHGNAVPAAGLVVSPATGSVAESLLTTDSTGLTRIAWRLGRAAGAQQLNISTVEGKVTTQVTARARPAAPANAEVLSPPVTGTAGRALAKPVTVLVTDAYGNAVPNVLAVFSVSAGTVAPARVMTDEKGIAVTRWTLGSTPGEQTLTAAVRGTTVRTVLTLRATAPRRP